MLILDLNILPTNKYNANIGPKYLYTNANIGPKYPPNQQTVTNKKSNHSNFVNELKK